MSRAPRSYMNLVSTFGSGGAVAILALAAWVLVPLQVARVVLRARTCRVGRGERMRLSRESRYAIEALLTLADHGTGHYVGTRRIAAEAGLPMAYLQKILRQLARAGVLEAARGRGFALARPATEISLREVLVAIEGEELFGGRCIFWREECSEAEPCELHFRWKELKPAVEDAIARTTLDEVRRRGVPADLGAAGA